ncbi:MAG: Zinc-specific metallo-regulatory protein [Firmicutes bacterium ADurb.Bin419]|nr:MAG: Zinc-specific metallo-regulatory protein [Firmicutes bacterium ADurb.Bin419]
MDQNDNRELLNDKGIKFTNQRNITFNVLQQADLPITAEQVFMRLKEVDSTISLSTVYRILDMFVSKGLVLKSNISDDNKAMFELNRMEHKHHLICIGCKKITVIDNCPLEVYEKTLEQKTKYQITAHKLEIFGFCQLCQAKGGEIQC